VRYSEAFWAPWEGTDGKQAGIDVLHSSDMSACHGCSSLSNA